MNLKKYLSAGIAALVLVTGTVVAQQQAPPKPTPQRPDNPSWGAQTREEKRRLREVREKQGLKEAARLYGAYIENIDFDDELAPMNLASLAGVADLIVRGLVKSNWSVLTRTTEGGYPEGIETIVTDYTVQVLDVYKGDLKMIGRDIAVRIPGGRVLFESPLYAEIRTPGFARPLNQQEFIWFLDQNPSEGKRYSIAFSRQGLFEVMPEGWVSPRASAGSPIAKQAKKNFREFEAQLYAALGVAGRAGK